jgi:uncharacterized membrane protein YesL
LSDTLEHLLPFTMASLSWWLAVFLVLPGPGATIALFQLVDPRLTSELDRPGLRQSARVTVANLKRGWILALCTLPVLLLLLYNLGTYQSLESRLAILAPLWVVLLLLGLISTLSAFAMAALFGQPATVALRHGILLSAARLPRAFVVVVLIWLLLFVGTLLVVPLVMFLPATIAAITSRLVLDGLGVPVTDPLAPTDERLQEEQSGKTTPERRWGIGVRR